MAFVRRASCVVAVLACVLACATPASAQTAPTTCPSTFAVLHDDRIGDLQLPPGNYTSGVGFRVKPV